MDVTFIFIRQAQPRPGWDFHPGVLAEKEIAITRADVCSFNSLGSADLFKAQTHHGFFFHRQAAQTLS
jgi:hypothetical protein